MSNTTKKTRALNKTNKMASSSLPAQVSVDRPLKLGETFLQQETKANYYTLKLDFQPESVQQAQHADLLLLEQGQVRRCPQPTRVCVPLYAGCFQQQHE